VKRSSMAQRPWTSAETYHRADPGMPIRRLREGKGGKVSWCGVRAIHCCHADARPRASTCRGRECCPMACRLLLEVVRGAPHEGPHENSTARSTASHRRSMRHDQDDDHDVGRLQPPSAAALRTGRVDPGDRSSTGGQPRRRGGGRSRRWRAARPCHRRSLWRHSGRSGQRRCGGRVSESGGGGEQHVRGGGAIPGRGAARIPVPELLPLRRGRCRELDASGPPPNRTYRRPGTTPAACFIHARA